METHLRSLPFPDCGQVCRLPSPPGPSTPGLRPIPLPSRTPSPGSAPTGPCQHPDGCSRGLRCERPLLPARPPRPVPGPPSKPVPCRVGILVAPSAAGSAARPPFCFVMSRPQCCGASCFLCGSAWMGPQGVWASDPTVAAAAYHGAASRWPFAQRQWDQHHMGAGPWHRPEAQSRVRPSSVSCSEAGLSAPGPCPGPCRPGLVAAPCVGLTAVL